MNVGGNNKLQRERMGKKTASWVSSILMQAFAPKVSNAPGMRAMYRCKRGKLQWRLVGVAESRGRCRTPLRSWRGLLSGGV